MHAPSLLLRTSSQNLCPFNHLILFGHPVDRILMRFARQSSKPRCCPADTGQINYSGTFRTMTVLARFARMKTSPGVLNTCWPNIQYLLIQEIWENLSKNTHISETTKSLIAFYFQGTETNKVQLILDPSVLPKVISTKQVEGPHIYDEIFHFSRSWCYSIHKKRLKLLGRWKIWSMTKFLDNIICAIIQYFSFSSKLQTCEFELYYYLKVLLVFNLIFL